MNKISDRTKAILHKRLEKWFTDLETRMPQLNHGEECKITFLCIGQDGMDDDEVDPSFSVKTQREDSIDYRGGD